jgi:hypothetical protein
MRTEAMRRHGCRTRVFSSTATVVGEPEQFPITETFPTNPLHPYAQTKLAWLQRQGRIPGGPRQTLPGAGGGESVTPVRWGFPLSRQGIPPERRIEPLLLLAFSTNCSCMNCSRTGY